MKSWRYELPQGRVLCLGERSLIMGILNVTQDSFYSASRILDEKELISKAAKMLEDGADILDAGALSTRPGAARIEAEEERVRIIPALAALRKEFPDAIISADTMKPEIARDAAEAGADIINDVGDDPAMGEVALKTGLPLVVTHCEDLPSSECSDIVGSVMNNLSSRLSALQRQGVKKLIVDPGIGFGKGKHGSYNMKLLKSIGSFRSFGLPILVGHSRKSFLDIEYKGVRIAPEPEDRLPGTLAVSALLASNLVEIIRVHDVLENARAVRTTEAIL
ncbi:MAG: dihydropteroate synthase [Synergistaceae bacterium]|nr:dihydropteroate synthase [Synergistaceae bacterium]